MVAEYSTVAPSSQARVSYLRNDHLGSPRITTDASGKVFSRRDFMPFGEEIGSSDTWQRSVGLNYGEDGIRQKFTSKLRDNETDLDHFLARYYSSELGRFVSSDPIYISLDKLASPQTWNLFVYVGNNPLAYTDPTGMERIQLGQHTDKEINGELKKIDKEKENIDKDKTKTKEQKRVDKEKLDRQANTLKSERKGNHMVEAMIKALPKDERGNLQASDFTLLTDTKDDLLKWKEFNTAFGDSANEQATTAATKNMFVIGEGRFSQQIFINGQHQNIQAALGGKKDFIGYGGTVIKHEEVHRGGNASEVDAYTRQRDILDKMPNAFTSPVIQGKFREFINSQITEYGGKP